MKKTESFFEDYREVRFLLLEEILTKDEIEEGLTPMSESFRVCITSHAYNRMYGDKSRYCDYQWVENLLISKSTGIINSPLNEDILVLSDDQKMAVVLELTKVQGEMSIVLISVIRNVISKNGLEIELKNRSNKKGKIII